MTQKQRIRQMQACHIRYKQLEREGAIAGDLPIHVYAMHLFELRDPPKSLKELSDVQLNQLRDALEGKPTKLHEKLVAAADAAGIYDLDAWMQVVAMRSRRMAWMRGYTIDTLPAPRKWRLCQMLEARAATRAMAPENRVVGHG